MHMTRRRQQTNNQIRRAIPGICWFGSLGVLGVIVVIVAVIARPVPDAALVSSSAPSLRLFFAFSSSINHQWWCVTLRQLLFDMALSM